MKNFNLAKLRKAKLA